MPASAGVSHRVPMRVRRDIATTGAVGFSRTRRVKPLGSRVRTALRAGAGACARAEDVAAPQAASPPSVVARKARRRIGY